MSDLDALGRWWIPGDEGNSVQGALRADESGATLELAGSLDVREQTPGEVVRGQVIFGLDERNRAITLLDASIQSRQGLPAQALALHAYTVLVGRFHPDRDPHFGACVFSLDGLAEWTESHFRLLRPVADSSGLPSGQSDSDSISFEVPRGKFTLSAGIAQHLSEVERSYRVRSSWFYEPATPKSLDDLLRDAITPLEYMHVLFTSEPTKPRDVQLLLPSTPGGSPQEHIALSVYANWCQGSVDRDRHRWQWPVGLAEIADRLPDVVDKWLELTDSTERALALLFGVLQGEKDLYLENRYLSLAQAAEAFHRQHPKFPARVISEEDFAEREDVLRDVAQRAGWWHDWLKSRVRYAYEPTFRQRLKDLVVEAGDFGGVVFPRDILSRVVDRRNELTHVLEPIGEHDQRIAEIYMLGEKTALLLMACVLANLGFGDEEIRAALTKNPHHKMVADYSI
jgi:hypothetical protein